MGIRPSRRHGFELTDHVCRVCFGRVLARTVADRTEYICADCGLATSGAGPVTAICSCGTKFPTGRRVGIRCVRNPAPGVIPNLFIASEEP